MSLRDEPQRITSFGVVASGTGVAKTQPQARLPRWAPGFVLDLVCWVRDHKPHPVPPFVWEDRVFGVRWEFCARCGRFFGRRIS